MGRWLGGYMKGCELRKSLELLLIAFFAVSAYAVNVAPLHFEGVADEFQQSYWEDLMKYKLWGTTGIEFDDRHIVIDDGNGYTGTASGDFIIDQPHHTLGGTILVGKNLEIDDGKEDTLKVGPVHVLGDLILPGYTTMEDKSRFYGNYCIQGNIQGNYVHWRQFLSDGLVYGDFPEADAPYADCPLDVPSVDTHLKVPIWDPPADAEWIPAINMTQGVAEIRYIDVPPSVSSSEVYDAYVESISMAGHADKRLYVRMQDGGRLTRLYVRDGLNIQGAANAAKIQVLYVNDDATWNGSTWENFDLESSAVVANIDYGGNLLIYTPMDIEWPHFNQNNDAAIFQGTYMTSGKLSVKGHIMVAGQFISNNLYFSNEITGDFRYVPFDPSKINIRTTKAVVEDHLQDTLKLYLDKAPPTAVPFTYCFEFLDKTGNVGDKSSGNRLAHIDDLVETADDIPVCSLVGGNVVGDFVSSKFAKGSVDPVTPIVVHPVYDALEENDESFKLWVCDLEAAIYADGDRASNCYSFPITIKNVPKNPIGADFSITAVKDKAVNISSFPAMSADSVALTDYLVKIVNAPQKGTLALNGTRVVKGDTISSSDLANLYYQNAAGDNQYGRAYDSVVFAIIRENVSSLENYTMTINVTKFSVKENTAAGFMVGVVESPEIKSGSTFSMNDASGIFQINESTGTIVVKNGTIDYEASNNLNYNDHAYGVTVYILESDVVVDSIETFISVLDVNDAPVVKDTVMSVRENELSGTTVGILNVYDQDGVNTNFRENTISIDGKSDLFSIDAKTGEIKTKAILDYEALALGQKFYTIPVKVVDNDGNESKANVRINVVNVLEIPKIYVTHAETMTGNYQMDNPNEIRVNESNMTLSWKAVSGKEISGKKKDEYVQPDTLLENLHEGYNVVALKFFDKTEDSAAVKNVVIFVCTKTPDVNVSTDAWSNTAANIYTVAEQRDASDTSYYVNKTKNTITISVKEPVLDETYTDSTCNYKTKNITLDVNLNTLLMDQSSLNAIREISSEQILLNDISAQNLTRSPYNDSLFLISYTDKINGKNVTVSFVENAKGDIVGDKFTVAYQANLNGTNAVLSYDADARTGKPIEDADGFIYKVAYAQSDAQGNTVELLYKVTNEGAVAKDSEGNIRFEVKYDYVSEIGNRASESISIILDELPPVVVIKSPLEDDIIYANFVDVVWTVDKGDGKGPVEMDTLAIQGLAKGSQGIVRAYCDKARNCAADTVIVIMKNAKDVDISVEQPVTIVTRDKTDEYYAANPPEDGEKYAVSIYNTKTGKEVETQVNGPNGLVEGSGDEPYPGLDGHLGPTLVIDVRTPSVSGIAGLATFDDLLDKDGFVMVDGVDAASSEKVTVSQYVEGHCDEDFKYSLAGNYSSSALAKANLYNTTMTVKIWVFTSLGSFVEYFEFDQDLNDPTFVNDAAMMTLFFEMKPDFDGYVRSKDGRLFGTGAYIYKTEVDMKSTLRCDLPPIHDETLEANKVGAKRKVSESLLKPFGYKRPKNK